jgi:plastocyanin
MRAGLFIVAVVAAGCGEGGMYGSPASGPAPAADAAAPEASAPDAPAPDGGTGSDAEADVVATGFDFVDGDVTVELGGELTWANEDGAAHPLVFSDGRRFDLPGGGSATVNFDEPGVFSYACAVHSNMTGTVTVLEADGTAPASAPSAGDADGSGSGSGGMSDDYSY